MKNYKIWTDQLLGGRSQKPPSKEKSRTSLMNSITHLNTNPSQTLLKREEKETPPSSFYKASITLYQKQTNTLQENHRANSLMNREPKVFKKNISNKKIMHYDKMCLQGSKDGSTYTNQWMLNFVKCFFCIYWDNYFIIHFANLVYHPLICVCWTILASL